MKKALSIILVVLMVMTMLPLTAVSSFAASGEVNYSEIFEKEIEDFYFPIGSYMSGREQEAPYETGFSYEIVGEYMLWTMYELTKEEYGRNLQSWEDENGEIHTYYEYYEIPAEVVEAKAASKFAYYGELKDSGYLNYDSDSDAYIYYGGFGDAPPEEDVIFYGYEKFEDKYIAYAYEITPYYEYAEGDVEGVDYITYEGTYISNYDEEITSGKLGLVSIIKTVLGYDGEIVKFYSWEKTESVPDIDDVITKDSYKNGWYHDGTGWQFFADGKKLRNCWKTDSQGWCYLGADGYCLTNDWASDSQGWCYLDANGRMVYNKWIYDGGKWYFINANGYMVSNQWKKDSIGWCYLGSSGAMLTNAWVKDSVGWCYVGADGYCVTNTWKADSKGWCYLDASGRMATNKWVKDSVGWCYVGADGYCVTNQWMKDSKGWCYLDEDGRMATNALVLDSKGVCFVGADGYMQTDVVIEDGYGLGYIKKNGYLAIDEWVEIEGERYYAGPDGYLDL